MKKIFVYFNPGEGENEPDYGLGDLSSSQLADFDHLKFNNQGLVGGIPRMAIFFR